MRPSFLKRLSVGAALALMPMFSAHGFGVGLQPTTVEMEIEPGQRMRQVVTLVNVHKEKPISLTIGLADWSLDKTGQIALAPPGDNPKSAAEWVRFSPAFVTLKPGESQQVVVEMMAPVRIDTTGDHRFALLASTLLPEERGGQSGVWKRYQIASLFYLTLDGAESLPVIKKAEVRDGEGGGSQVILEIGNDGDAHARLGGELDIVDASGSIIETREISNLVVLDNAERVFNVNVDVAIPDDAKIEVRLENTFSPQDGGIVDLETFRSPVVRQVAFADEDLPVEVAEGPAGEESLE